MDRKRHHARALWYEGPRSAKLRAETLPEPEVGDALISTSFSAISRGTERLVFEGRVPPTEWERMRAPHQDGALPFPVKYGYAAVGKVELGPPELLGKSVFCLAPHQDHLVLPAEALHVIPPGVPQRRACLAAHMETALNALWDSGAGPGDEIYVIGAGVLGVLVAALAAQLPGAVVTVLDKDRARRAVVEPFGARFLEAEGSVWLGDGTADIVFHASATPEGLGLAMACAGLEGVIVELSWYGEGETPVALGGAFHANRLRLVSSQVGHVSPSRRPRWSRARRLEKALSLLADARFDGLFTTEVAFDDLPAVLPQILAPGAPGLAAVVRY